MVWSETPLKEKKPEEVKPEGDEANEEGQIVVPDDNG